jgi:hypothetical protein
MEKKKKNLLSGQAFIDNKGNLLFKRGLQFNVKKFDPEITHREWIYLFVEAIKEKPYPKESDFIRGFLGSPATEKRTKNGLIKKGYL